MHWVHVQFIYCTPALAKMTFSKEDRVLIKVLRMEKGYTCWKFLNEFPGKNWNHRALYRLIAQIDAIGNAGRKQGSGRPRSGRSEANIETVEDMILSQEDHVLIQRFAKFQEKRALQSHLSMISFIKISIFNVSRRREHRSRQKTTSWHV